MRTFRIALLVLAIGFPAPVRANAPTPFVTPSVYKVGVTYTEPGSIVSLGGTSYLVVLEDEDTHEFYVLHAWASKGVVKADQIGKPMKVEAKIESRGEKGTSLKIISVKE